LVLLFGRSVVSQTAALDYQAPTLVNEVQQLRKDLRNITALAQRTQIAIYRLQAQSAVFDRASQAFDQMRDRCTQQQSQQRLIAAQIERAETQKRAAQNTSDRETADEMLGAARNYSEIFSSEMSRCQTELTDAESRLRLEQAKMNELQDQLDRLDRELAKPGV
jgi:hypothetical protein